MRNIIDRDKGYASAGDLAFFWVGYSSQYKILGVVLCVGELLICFNGEMQWLWQHSFLG